MVKSIVHMVDIDEDGMVEYDVRVFNWLNFHPF
jgi:hypothetical protein